MMIHKILLFASILFFDKCLYSYDIYCNSLSLEGAICIDQARTSPDVSIKLSTELEKYYSYINLATRAIYRNDFMRASILYDSAFTYKDQPFYVDIKNYIIVNKKCALQDKNDIFIRLLLTEKHIDTTFLFAELPRRIFNNKNISLIKSLQIKKKGKLKIENYSQQTIRSMFDLDHQVRKYEDFNMHDRYSSKQVYARRDSMDSENARKFLCLYEDVGFPTEESVGIYYDKDHQWSNVIFLLLVHFMLSTEEDDILIMLEKELLNGNLHPSIYATLAEKANDNSKVRSKKAYNFMNTTINLVDDIPYRPFVYYSDSLMNEVNTNRISIGLDSFHITQKQVISDRFCQVDSKDKDFIRMVPYTNIDTYTYAFVKSVFDKEKQDISKYKINAEKILQQCNCPEKHY